MCYFGDIFVFMIIRKYKIEILIFLKKKEKKKNFNLKYVLMD